LQAGELANAIVASRIPGELQAAGGKFVLAGQIEVRRQHGAFLNAAEVYDLRYGKLLKPHSLFCQAGVNERESAVGGAKVDTDDVT
jgi:hypothetical protein